MSSVTMTLDEIHQGMLDSISDDYEKQTGTFTSDFLRSVAIESQEIREDISVLYSKLDMSNYSGAELDRQVLQKKGLTRKAAVKATGKISLTGSGTVSAGDLFETENGVQYQAVTGAVITDNGEIDIEAVEAGDSGNVGANSIVLIPVTIPGFSEVTNTSPTSGGYDEETDESLYERYIIEVQKPSTSGNVYHYMKWAREVAGVGSAKIFPLENGNNTVGITIADDNGLIPGQELVDAVQDYIDPGITGTGMGEAPIGAYCTVSAATAKSVDITATLVITAGHSLAEIEARYEVLAMEYLKGIVFTGKSVSYAIMGSLMLDVEGVEDWSDFQINGVTSNIPVASKEVAVLAGVVLSE